MSAPHCPMCQKPVQRRPANRFFPFCSERCRLVDLGKWLGEEYRIPAGPQENEDETPDGPGRGDGRGEV
jgi:endogenous inhibitor of DNA gyrase (YacG/DUF329 family)